MPAVWSQLEWIYFALAKGGLALASIHPSATPIWPTDGWSRWRRCLWGYRTWPAISRRAVDRQCDDRRLGLPPQLRLRTGNSLKAVVALT